VTGPAGNYAFDASAITPMRMSAVAQKPAAKIIQGDWNWETDRSVDVGHDAESHKSVLVSGFCA
jgi:hypothetical protein